MPAPSFTCPFCGAQSFHPRDIRETYCGRCHVFACDIVEELKAGLSVDNSHLAVAQSTAVRAFEALMVRTTTKEVLRIPRPIAVMALTAIEKVIGR